MEYKRPKLEGAVNDADVPCKSARTASDELPGASDIQFTSTIRENGQQQPHEHILHGLKIPGDDLPGQLPVAFRIGFVHILAHSAPHSL